MKRLAWLACVLLGPLGCGGDDDDAAAACDAAGAWTLTETTTDGTCTEIGAVNLSIVELQAAGDAFSARFVGSSGVVECEGAIAGESCAGELVCSPTVDVEGETATLRLAYRLAFEGEAVTGSMAIEATGAAECSGEASVRGSR